MRQNRRRLRTELSPPAKEKKAAAGKIERLRRDLEVQVTQIREGEWTAAVLQAETARLKERRPRSGTTRWRGCRVSSWRSRRKVLHHGGAPEALYEAGARVLIRRGSGVVGLFWPRASKRRSSRGMISACRTR